MLCQFISRFFSGEKAAEKEQRHGKNYHPSRATAFKAATNGFYSPNIGESIHS
jgi:hypothetical protein